MNDEASKCAELDPFDPGKKSKNTEQVVKGKNEEYFLVLTTVLLCHQVSRNLESSALLMSITLVR